MSKVYLYTARATTAEKVQFDKKDTSVSIDYMQGNTTHIAQGFLGNIPKLIVLKIDILVEAQQRWDSNPCQLTVNFLISDALDHCANQLPCLKVKV